MPYIPPHRRLSQDSNKPPLVPELVPHFIRNVNIRSSRNNGDRSGEIAYADGCISRWFAVGVNGDNQFPSSVRLEPISIESSEQRPGQKYLVLVNGNISKEKGEVKENELKSQWESIAENVWQDLLSSFRNVRDSNKVKSSLVARFGKILFHKHGNSAVGLESVRGNPVTEATLRQLKQKFYTSVPTSYVEEVSNGVVTEVGFDFEREKDLYHLKLSDSTQPESTISCKCIVNKDKRLELHKVELNKVRHMVMDISSLDKNLDLRLGLYTKKILTELTEDEMQRIRDVVTSAILDPEVKGGLRWPLGKSYSGDRYSVVAVGHIVTKSYKNEKMGLKVKHADRFDFEFANGDAIAEVILFLNGVASEILEDKIDPDTIYNDFKDNIKLIWDHFLCSNPFLSDGK